MKNKQNSLLYLIIGMMLACVSFFLCYRWGCLDSVLPPTLPPELTKLTYVDQAKEFSIKVPGNWQLTELTDAAAGIALRSPSYQLLTAGLVEYQGEFYVRTIPNPNNLDIPDLFALFNDTSNSWFEQFDHEQLTINGYEAIKFPLIHEAGQTIDKTLYLVKIPDQVFSLSYLYSVDEADPEIELIFEEIIMSLTLIESSIH